MRLRRKKDTSSSSFEPDDFSLGRDEEQHDPTHQPKAHHQAPKSSEDHRRSVRRIEDPLTTNKEK
jgi:hypothetical protein